ncbi:MAG TPA: DUF1932 domain-containing protein [Telmatospirillum sp.]|nr:DUF1932 domain-containing protein [Telmatospirillum sp.]
MRDMSVTLIGYGEVGHIFARDLLDGGRVSVCVYDSLFDDVLTGPAHIDEARVGGVRPAASASEAAAGAHLVISAVTASSSLDVALQAGGYLRSGQVFLDINSVSPQIKQASAAAIEAAGADYVEAAVMAPVTVPGLAVPILLGGRTAADLAPVLTDLGMNVRVVASEVGRASATKLCRSIVIKGLEALMVDCAAAARHFGVEDDVFGSLQDTFPGTDFARLAQTMAGRVRRHGVRRAAEMREAAAMLKAMGLDPSLASAIAEAQDRHAERRQ